MKSSLFFGIIVALILTDFVLFPIDLMLGQNSKNIMAAIGLAYMFVNSSSTQSQIVDNRLFNLLLYSCLFGFICFVSVILNGTSDYTYVSYPVSCIIWLMSAYGVISFMRSVHGTVNVRIVGSYVVAVCFLQSIIALTIDLSSTFSAFVDSTIQFGQGYYRMGGRLYGIGCALDPAGVRMAAALVLCSFLILNIKKTDPWFYLPAYVLSFGVITMLGSMIARTTSVGALLGLGALAFFSIQRKEDQRGTQYIWKWICVVLALMIPLVIYFYGHNKGFHDNLRFGFEGFFNWIENGKWETGSTNQLQTMYVWPDNINTWIIGDGYFLGASNDPYYTGEDIGGVFYMNTDVGVCRFIFYCGMLGLLSFAGYFAKAAHICAQNYPRYSWMFWSLLLLNYAVWFKVATDCFVIFAMFIVMGTQEDEEMGIDKDAENEADLL